MKVSPLIVLFLLILSVIIVFAAEKQARPGYGYRKSHMKPALKKNLNKKIIRQQRSISIEKQASASIGLGGPGVPFGPIVPYQPVPGQFVPQPILPPPVPAAPFGFWGAGGNPGLWGAGLIQKLFSWLPGTPIPVPSNPTVPSSVIVYHAPPAESAPPSFFTNSWFRPAPLTVNAFSYYRPPAPAIAPPVIPAPVGPIGGPIPPVPVLRYDSVPIRPLPPTGTIHLPTPIIPEPSTIAKPAVIPEKPVQQDPLIFYRGGNTLETGASEMLNVTVAAPSNSTNTTTTSTTTIKTILS